MVVSGKLNNYRATGVCGAHGEQEVHVRGRLRGEIDFVVIHFGLIQVTSCNDRLKDSRGLHPRCIVTHIQ